MPEIPIQTYPDVAAPGTLDKLFTINEGETALGWTLAANVPAIATANATASTALTNANAAQATANTALANANTANTTANTKVTKTGDTMTGALTIPNGTAAGHAVNKGQMDTADALKVARAGDTMTGTLKTPQLYIEGTFSPVIMLHETDQPVDARKWRILTSATGFSLSAVNDAESVAQINAISVSRAGAISLNGTGVTAVNVPTPTAATHAATKAYVDAADNTKLAKAGDTMTGDLTITKAVNPALMLNGTGAAKPIIRFQDDGITRWDVEYDAPGGYLEFIRRDAAGSSWGSPVTFHDDGTVNLVSATKVQVPTVSGSGQAAEVTGYNATTGQLSICNREIGDTGWRNVSATWLSANWLGAGSTLLVRRVGSVVQMILNAVPTVVAVDPPTAIVTIPAGFQAKNTTPSADYVGYAESAANPSVAILRINGGGITVLTGSRLVDNALFVRLSPTYTTTDAWPSTLPGTVGLLEDEVELQSAAAAKPAKSKRKK